MTYTLSRASVTKLTGVHPDLVKVVKRLLEIAPTDFQVLEGVRTIARQKELLAQHATTTMRSRHITGHAVDIAPIIDGKVSWHWPHFYPLAEAMKKAAADVGVTVEWGGDWKTFKDGPHWQLPWDKYPA